MLHRALIFLKKLLNLVCHFFLFYINNLHGGIHLNDLKLFIDLDIVVMVRNTRQC